MSAPAEERYEPERVRVADSSDRYEHAAEHGVYGAYRNTDGDAHGAKHDNAPIALPNPAKSLFHERSFRRGRPARAALSSRQKKRPLPP